MLSVVFQIFLSVSAIAQSTTCEFAQTVHGPFTFRQVEMVSRVHEIGLWRGGDVTLKPWIEVSENAYLGIDKDGRAFNVIRLKDRTVAFLLSGERKIKDLFFKAPGTLLAVDDSGELLHYEAQIWARSSVSQIVARSFANYGITMCTAAAAVWIHSWIANSPLVSPESVGAMGVASVSALMIEGFRASVRFERQNELTDGFKSLGVNIGSFRQSEYIRDGQGRIVDYDLGEGRTLESLLEERLAALKSENFDLKCEHELLPRGIPPEEYEPRF